MNTPTHSNSTPRALAALLAGFVLAAANPLGHATTAASASPAASGPASVPPAAMHGQTAQKKRPPPVPVKLVDLNSASRKELKTLPGIGDAEATKIIANRPYLTKTELVTKQVLPSGPYLSLKNLVVAMPKAKPKATS